MRGIGILSCSPAMFLTENIIWQQVVVVGPDARPEDERHGEWEAVPVDGDWQDWADGGLRSVCGSDLVLRLDDPTGFIHGVWALAEREGLSNPLTARFTRYGRRTWRLTTEPPGGQQAGSPGLDEYTRIYTSEIHTPLRQLATRRGMARLWVEIPALADASITPQEALRVALEARHAPRP